MKKYRFSGLLQELIESAEAGKASDIDIIMSYLSNKATLAHTRYVDYALSLVEDEEGVEQIEKYLFNGTLIQRNYCSLFFNRKDEWEIVKQAYQMGLIDEIQAYSR